MIIYDSIESVDWIKALPGYQEELGLRYGGKKKTEGKDGNRKSLVMVVKPSKRED